MVSRIYAAYFFSLCSLWRSSFFGDTLYFVTSCASLDRTKWHLDFRERLLSVADAGGIGNIASQGLHKVSLAHISYVSSSFSSLTSPCYRLSFDLEQQWQLCLFCFWVSTACFVISGELILDIMLSNNDRYIILFHIMCFLRLDKLTSWRM